MVDCKNSEVADVRVLVEISAYPRAKGCHLIDPGLRARWFNANPAMCKRIPVPVPDGAVHGVQTES
jgi:hypothetical protein